MKTTVKLYRITTINCGQLAAAASIDVEKLESIAHLESVVRKAFYPLAPRFRIFYPSEQLFEAVKPIMRSAWAFPGQAGMECMSFDILEASRPQAGMVLTDPMLPQDVDRVDGALESELNRLGIGKDFDGFEWRMTYDIKGN